MQAHVEYLKYVLRHKWFVFRACLELGVPIWIAVLHDWTRFLPCEWFPYVHSFYNPDGSRREKVRDSSGAYDPTKVSSEFRLAWLHHQRNKHHWQAWAVIGDFGKLTVLPMPERYIKEMVADWVGVSKAQGKGTPRGWYEANKHKMRLHEESREALQNNLDKYLARKSE